MYPDKATCGKRRFAASRHAARRSDPIQLVWVVNEVGWLHR